MLSRVLRSAITSIILTAMTVAGLPIVVCVSQAHGAAIEFKDIYVNHHKNSQKHRTLFDVAENTVASKDCKDFSSDRGILAKQSRVKQPVTLGVASNDSPTLAPFESSTLFIARRFLSMRTSWGDYPEIRSSLSDLSTIVLLI
jgi:hypothetical protein